MTFLTMSLCVLNTAHAYKLVIYTDEAVTNKSDEVAKLMKSTYPFSKYDMEVEVVRVPPTDIECESTNGIDRLVTCKNAEDIQAKAMKRGGDQAMIVKNISKYGGSSGVGGGVPVITTGTPARAMVHEFLHTLGLCDEYEYAAEEAAGYCNNPSSKPNVTFITPQSAYASDAVARNRHSGEIPWYRDILDTTPITSSFMLGTGVVDFKKPAAVNDSKEGQVLGEPTGLFQGQVCNKATPKRISWHPGGGSTIMDKTASGLGAPLEKIVDRIMASKGAHKKLVVEEPKENTEKPAVSNDKNNAGEVVVKSDPQPEVNDTSRNMFKSFFTWLKDIFQQIMNVMPK